MKCLLSLLSLLWLGTFHNNVNAQNDETIEIWVDGVCGMCKDRIEGAALATIGVRFADWDVGSKQLKITKSPEPLDINQLHANITGVGHDTELQKATEEVYQALHVCCKYRDETISTAQGPAEKNSEQSIDDKYLKGVIVEENTKGEAVPLIGANIRWLNVNEGAVSDSEGVFEIERIEGINQLVVSYIGYESDTLLIDQGGNIVITLSDAVTLAEVKVTHRRKSTSVSFIEAGNIQYLSEDEFLKAACCSLAESFETTPSIDASFTDAVTGTRKIEMLGLASPYLQITRENMPDARGLSALYGLEFTAGPWIEGIQLNTGAGSVVNGFESITGQINVELWKPDKAVPVYLNLYGNAMGRLEGNLNLNHALNEEWQTGLLLHAKSQQRESDRNDDGFLDNPLSNHLIGINRWRFKGKNGWMGQAGIKGVFISNESGQMPDLESPWIADRDINRWEGWLKVGHVFEDRPYASMGFQFSAAYHDQENDFGSRSYIADQQSIYGNFIYQSIIKDSQHQFKTGMSIQVDEYEESIKEIAESETNTYTRTEWVPGAFFEYTYGKGEAFTAVAGLRADHHNQYGLFVTPRLNLRYAINEQLVWRVSGGRGQRTASIFAENIGLFASSRTIIVESKQQDTPYGLDAEVAWNGGTTLNWEFPTGKTSALLSLSYFHTHFTNQIVVDFDEDPQSVYFYNLDGTSFSNSIQTQIDFEPIDRWTVRMAYRYNDVEIDYKKGRLQKPLVSNHRAFFNTGYATKNGWKIDGTLSWQGERRIPSTESNPSDYQLDNYSPSFFLLNGQLSKAWGDQWEIYLGGENLLDFRQENPIIASDDPFGSYFDASLVWGPVFGRNVYIGMRYRLTGEQKK